MSVERFPEHEIPGEQMTARPSAPTPDEMCAVLARELRTPLSTVEGYLDLLAGGGVGPVTAEQREFLDVVVRNVRRLTVVVSDWLDISRLEAGRFELAQLPVDLLDVADRVVADLRPRIWAKEQRITVETPSEPALVLGDSRALVQVVSNLLSNAHKYTPPGGQIRLVLSTDRDDIVRLDVDDTGIGIRDEDQPYLFRKFFRAHLTESEPGTGLGLTLVKTLVERMGGSISIRSTFGTGSTFTVVLPRAVDRLLSPEDQPTSVPETVAACPSDD
jgi:signal transduction histidine kinase